MKLKELKEDDIINVALMDIGSGNARVTKIADEEVHIQWICFSPCYPKTRLLNPDGLVLTEDMETAADGCPALAALELLERRSDGLNAWMISEAKTKKMLDSYNENKKSLRTLEHEIFKNGCTDDGLSDATASFEQGYNNALQFVFETLGISFQY